jgi:uncharacterized membrane protein (UPF0127 family)
MHMKVVFYGLCLMTVLGRPVFTERQYVPVFFPGGESITAELALTEAERMTGLMFRETINADQGMLFVYDEEMYLSVWMKNVKFPIDILWLDKDKRIVHIAHSVPPCRTPECPSYSSEVPAMYFLELKAGCAKVYNLKLYDRIDFILDDS